jgi:hypothetical protein
MTELFDLLAVPWRFDFEAVGVALVRRWVLVRLADRDMVRTAGTGGSADD